MVLEIPPLGELRRSHGLRVGRARRVRAMQAQMPYRLAAISDPLLQGEDAIPDDTLDTGASILDLIIKAYTEGTAHVMRCDAYRNETAANTAGRVPIDEPVRQLHVWVPGGVPREVEVSDMATILEEPRLILYTVSSIRTDRLNYVSALTLDTFAHRGE